MCAGSLQRSEEGTQSPELELQKVVNHYVGPGTDQVLCKPSKYSRPPSPLSSPQSLASFKLLPFNLKM